MEAVNVYTAIGCNRTPEALDWGDNNLILFGACHSIAVFDPNYCDSSSGKILRTLAGHTARVNTVKWIRQKGPSAAAVQFISGSDDHRAIIWQADTIDAAEFRTYQLAQHSGGVTVVDTVTMSDGRLTVATASTDSSIKLWRLSNDTDSFEPFQTISLGNGLCFAIRMCQLPGTDGAIIMAVATDDDKIHLYTESMDGGAFVLSESLSGHEDWVRGLDFIQDNADNDLLLASSGQDTFIRLWRISGRNEETINEEVAANEIIGGDIKVEERIFECGRKRFAITLESVLLGHDAWVYAVHWNRLADGRLQLLSASIDKTMILWQAADDDGVWIDRVRVGDVGGNSLGFFGGKIAATGTAIVGHGYQGSLHIWQRDNERPESWRPAVVAGGHFNEARDFAWEPNGEFMISVSADQTTRCHVPWRRPSQPSETWHELARPQVHGYDMQTLAMLDRYRFASAAEEKIVRTFQAPANFVENFRRICGQPAADANDVAGDAILASKSKGASVPSLGLSNKVVNDDDVEAAPMATEQKHVKDQYPENYFVPVTLNAPPPEETLMQNTLWPETQKLYGHGYDVYALAATSDGKLLASSCKATNAEHAQIILWNTTTWKQHQKLAAHQLTITQLAFSPDNTFLLSTSRDRRWALFSAATINDTTTEFKLIAQPDKSNGIHGRIIWTCAWTHDSQYFATGSRDGKCVLWHKGDTAATDNSSSLGPVRSVHVLELKNESITALAFGRRPPKSTGEYLAAVGTDTGSIRIYGVDIVGSCWTELLLLNAWQAHHLTVRRLSFRPFGATGNALQLASCGDDHLVRLYEFRDK